MTDKQLADAIRVAATKLRAAIIEARVASLSVDVTDYLYDFVQDESAQPVDKVIRVNRAF